MNNILKYLKQKNLEIVVEDYNRYLVSGSKRIGMYSINDYLTQDGIGNITNYPINKKVSEIVKLEVDKDYRNQGYGSLIFNLGVMEILDQKTDYFRILTINEKVMNNLKNLWESPTFLGNSINDYIIDINLRREGLAIASSFYFVETLDKL